MGFRNAIAVAAVCSLVRVHTSVGWLLDFLLFFIISAQSPVYCIGCDCVIFLVTRNNVYMNSVLRKHESLGKFVVSVPRAVLSKIWSLLSS